MLSSWIYKGAGSEMISKPKPALFPNVELQIATAYLSTWLASLSK